MAGLDDAVSPVHFDSDAKDARFGSDFGLTGTIVNPVTPATGKDPVYAKSMYGATAIQIRSA